jgi:surfactin synthase thioesterase subunit
MAQSSPGDALWCRRYHPADNPTARLVCLPHAGGSAPFYRPVAVALGGGGIDVVAVQYPGRLDRHTERPADDLSVLVDQVHEVLRRQPPLPLTLFGHSMGAVIAFEVTRRLEAEGQTPARLFASGRRAPSTHRDEEAHRSDEAVMAEVRRLSGTASVLLGDEDLMRATLPALRADFRAIETYRCEPGASVSTAITVLTGDADPKTTLDEARAWERHTSGDFDLRVFPGGHFFISDRSKDVMRVLEEHFRGERARTAG